MKKINCVHENHMPLKNIYVSSSRTMKIALFLANKVNIGKIKFHVFMFFYFIFYKIITNHFFILSATFCYKIVAFKSNIKNVGYYFIKNKNKKT